VKKVIATMAVAALAAWAAPASAGVIFSDPGATIGKGFPLFYEVTFSAAGFSNVKLTWDTDGLGGNDACGTNGTDCFTVSFNGAAIPGFEDIGVPRSDESHGPIYLGDNPAGTVRFESTFSSSNEGIEISNIQVRNRIVSEPASLALFGLGLAGLGFMRRKQSA